MTRTTKEVTAVFMGRAEKGAALMDRYRPGWHQQIDQDRLNLRYGDDCISGQCFGDYPSGIKVLGLVSSEQMHYGFFLYSTESKQYPLLTACWKKLINQRLAEDEREIQTAALPTPTQNAPQQNRLTTNAV